MQKNNSNFSFKKDINFNFSYAANFVEKRKLSIMRMQ